MPDRMTWRDSALAWSTDDPDAIEPDPELLSDKLRHKQLDEEDDARLSTEGTLPSVEES